VAVSRASLGPLAITSDSETTTSLNLVGDEAKTEEPEALDDRVETSGGAGRVRIAASQFCRTPRYCGGLIKRNVLGTEMPPADAGGICNGVGVLLWKDHCDRTIRSFPRPPLIRLLIVGQQQSSVCLQHYT